MLNLGFTTKYHDAAAYWENRYLRKGTSGAGSYGDLAAYKADFLNQFVNKNNIGTVIELGCGDGNQLQLYKFQSYIGLDVSPSAIKKCISIFENDNTRSFFMYNPDEFMKNHQIFSGDLALSVDVIYHLVEDDIFESYLHHLFSCSRRFVIIYAWDVESERLQHVRHRKFTVWIEKNIKNWSLVETIENKSPLPACDFFIYKKSA